MRRKGIAFWLAFAMLCSFIMIVVEIAPNVEGLTIYVDDDYGSEDATHKKTIYSAIENASNGDTINVYNGEYNGKFGQIIIDKSVDIIGQSSDLTVINNTAVYIASDNIILSNFSVKDSIVHIWSFSNIEINYCSFSAFGSIDIDSSSDIRVSNSSIKDRGYLWITGSSNIYIENTKMNNTQYPLWLDSSSNIYIANCNLTYLDDYGVWFDESINCEMRNTTILSDDYGGIRILWGWGSESKYFNHTIDTSNTVNGKPVYYFYNKTDLVLSGLDAGHITLALCSNITLKDSNATGGDGVKIAFSSGLNITNNNLSSNLRSGIQILTSSNYNNITDNYVSENGGSGIRLWKAIENNFINNTLYLNGLSGFYIESYSNNNTFVECNLIENKWGFQVRGENNVFSKNLITDNWDRGIWLMASDSKNNLIVNNSLKDNNLEFYLTEGSNAIILNTTFNKSRVEFFMPDDAYLVIQWFLHVNVTDYLGNPVSNANVKIEDNKNGTYNETFMTDGNGYVKWIPVTEYIQWSTEKTFYTPHRIIAWNDTLTGYAYPDPIMNKSKTINIVLFNGTYMDLEPGWNLVSLPRVQSDTNIETVFQSIDGSYNSVWRYNITDYNDLWKHYHVSKPSYMNDLWKLNHTMGFWLYVTDPGGTTLVVFGDVLTSDQHIPLYPGWNLVGYPSLTSYNRTDGLNNINFGSEVDPILTFNSTSKKWVKLDEPTDYFEVGRGYWIYSKVTKTWVVPL